MRLCFVRILYSLTEKIVFSPQKHIIEKIRSTVRTNEEPRIRNGDMPIIPKIKVGCSIVFYSILLSPGGNLDFFDGGLTQRE